MKANLLRNGFVEPTPVQAEAIPPALAGRDVVATAKFKSSHFRFQELLVALASAYAESLPRGPGK